MNLRKPIGIIVTVCLLLGCCAGCGQVESQPDVPEETADRQSLCAEAAKEIADAVIETYCIDTSNDAGASVLLRDTADPEKGISQGVASVWHYTAFMAMVSRMETLTGEEQYAELYAHLRGGLEYYKGSGQVTTYADTATKDMYVVNRAQSPASANVTEEGAVYDDQMWIIREFLYAYLQTGEVAYLEDAKTLTQLCLEGWDSTLREDGTAYGGIPWGPTYQTKHTCSNAPIVSALVQLYEIESAAGNSQAAGEYLDWAKKIYAFVKDNLQNEDGTYGDLLGSDRELVGEGADAHYVTTGQSAAGDIDHTAYTYNTGAMISGGAALYRVTGEAAYLEDAKASAKAAYTVLADNDQVEGCSLYTLQDTTVWFQLVLLEGYLELAPYDADCDTYLDDMAGYWLYTYGHFNQYGFLPRNGLTGWDPENDKDTAKDIMDQAAAAQMLALLAGYYAGE